MSSKRVQARAAPQMPSDADIILAETSEGVAAADGGLDNGPGPFTQGSADASPWALYMASLTRLRRDDCERDETPISGQHCPLLFVPGSPRQRAVGVKPSASALGYGEQKNIRSPAGRYKPGVFSEQYDSPTGLEYWEL